jgi:hypothetical protein
MDKEQIHIVPVVAGSTASLVAPLSESLPYPAADPALLEVLLQPRLSLFWGAHTPTRTLLAAATTLASRGQPLRIFDGGNRFDGYFVARLARRLSSDPQTTLTNIRLSRAFTCFQMAELIENTPADLQPLFLLDLLATFYDESVPLRDTERLLATTIAHLKRLASTGPVIVGAREPQSLVKDRWTLLDRLQTAADATWLLRAPEEIGPLQPSLF